MDNLTDTQNNNPKRFNIKNSWIYLVIIALLIGTNIYLFFQKRQTKTQAIQMEEQLYTVSSEKDLLQKEFDASLVRLDDLTGKNVELRKALESSSSEIAQTKNRIQTILTKGNATEVELKEARGLIKNLNGRIEGYEKQIAGLKQRNATLSTERDSVAKFNTQLQEKIDLGKILHASNIQLIPIDLRRGGKKEKETTKARRVDFLRITFDIDQNRLVESGVKDIKIRIQSPDGNLLSNAALGSGSIVKHDGATLYYSLAKLVELEANRPLTDIHVDWKQSSDYLKGVYAVEIYYDGYLIGSGNAALK